MNLSILLIFLANEKFLYINIISHSIIKKPNYELPEISWEAWKYFDEHFHHLCNKQSPKDRILETNRNITELKID